MSETRFTPGPWEWGAEDYSMAWLTAAGEHGEAGDPYGDHVLTVKLCENCQKHVRTSGEENDGWRFDRCATINAANAYLISAAPDMYAALVSAEIAAMELCIGQDPANQCWVVLAEIRAALSKANPPISAQPPAKSASGSDSPAPSLAPLPAAPGSPIAGAK